MSAPPASSVSVPIPAPASTLPRGWLMEFVLLAAIWGASFLFMRLGAAQFGPLPTAGVRVLVATLFLAPIMLRLGQGAALRQHWRPMLLAGVINSAIPFALFSWAVLHMATGLTSILNATTPLFGALIAWVWLGERITRLRGLGLALGFGGVALLAWGTQRSVALATPLGLWPLAAALAASTFYGLAASYARRHLAGLPALATATGSQLGATLGLALPTLWAWPAHMPGARAWAAVIAMGVLCTGVAYILYFRLIERVGASRALAVTFLAPVFAVGYGSVFLHEPVTLWMLGCGAVIVLGTMLSTGLLPRPRTSG